MEVAEEEHKVHFSSHDMKNPSENKLCQELKTILQWLQKEDKYAKLGMWAKTETIKNPIDMQDSSINHILGSKKNEKAGFSGTLLVRSTQDFHSLKKSLFLKLQTRKIILRKMHSKCANITPIAWLYGASAQHKNI